MPRFSGKLEHHQSVKRLRMSVMFWPPKPKLFESATSTLLSPGHVRDVVEVAIRVGVVEIDGWGKHAVADGQEADDRLDAAGRGDQVAHHALGAGDRHLVGRLAEGPLDRQGLDRVVDRSAGAVGVDVVDVVRGDPGVARASRMQAMAPRPSSWLSVIRKASAVEP